jgi:hypothetical protein
MIDCNVDDISERAKTPPCVDYPPPPPNRRLLAWLGKVAALRAYGLERAA